MPDVFTKAKRSQVMSRIRAAYERLHMPRILEAPVPKCGAMFPRRRMADVFTKAKRSEVMSRIRSRGNRDTELALARLLRANHITGWRRHLQVRIAEIAESGKHGVTRPTFR
jgi:G:T-mismatch repair DNA endonuclease (very short patch repair protein)